MKQALIVVVCAIALVAWFFLWFRNEGAVKTSAARPWPGEMGSLDAAVARWPSLKANDGWTFDGTTLRFSREIATGAPDTPMPLVLHVKP